MSSKLGALTRSPSISSTSTSVMAPVSAMKPSLTPKTCAERHAQHGRQEPADDDGGEQLVRDVRLDAQLVDVQRLPRPAAEAVGVHRAERDGEGHHQDRERRRPPVLPEEVHELGAGDAVQHLRRQVAQQHRRAHEVGREADHQHQRRDRQLERARQRQRHRRHHQDDDDVVDEHRDRRRPAPTGSSPAARGARPTAAAPAPTASSARRSCRSSPAMTQTLTAGSPSRSSRPARRRRPRSSRRSTPSRSRRSARRSVPSTMLVMTATIATAKIAIAYQASGSIQCVPLKTSRRLRPRRAAGGPAVTSPAAPAPSTDARPAASSSRPAARRAPPARASP